MFHTPAAGTLYYRVTRKKTRPSGLLSGMGSYSTLGGRSHRPHQRTVYASDDVLVAITEMAFYQALEWRERIGGGRTGTPTPLPRPTPPTYPLVSSHRLWAFTLTTPPWVIDLDHPTAYVTFRHVPIEILNPGQAYEATQSLPTGSAPSPIPTIRVREGSRRPPSARRPRAATNPLSMPCPSWPGGSSAVRSPGGRTSPWSSSTRPGTR